MSIILYNRQDCPFCWKVRLVGSHLGVKFAFTDVERGVKHPEVVALNPAGTVPVMLDNDLVLSESGIIAQYLDKKYGSGKLLPDDPDAYSRILQLCHYSDTIFGKAIFPFISEKRKSPPEERDAEILAQSVEKFNACLNWLEPHSDLLGNPETPNMLDFTFFPRFALACEYQLDFSRSEVFSSWFEAFNGRFGER